MCLSVKKPAKMVTLPSFLMMYQTGCVLLFLLFLKKNAKSIAAGSDSTHKKAIAF